jgi:hypothetical protein
MNPTAPGLQPLYLERPTGEQIQFLGWVDPEHTTVLSGTAPGGRFQPVLRGGWRVGDEKRTFVLRGPLVEGRPAVEVAALRAQERPPVFPGSPGGLGEPRVGVYMGGLGAETLLKGLARQPGARVAAVYRLRPEHLAVVDTLLMPQLADIAELDAATQARLRQWVESGRTLILTHDAIGARWHPRLFPEIVRNVELKPATLLQTAPTLKLLPPSTVFRHQGSDQFRITPGPSARVLLFEVIGKGEGPSATIGAPVVVAGPVGRGTVILAGFLSGYQVTEMAPEESRLLAALTRFVQVRQGRSHSGRFQAGP